jgi:hypothetical protein
MRRLPTVSSQAEGLGRPTIMDRALAAEHGAAYVHLAVFAIDVDRVHDALEGLDDPYPFGWEVFLTECYVLERGLADEPRTRAMLEEVIVGVLERAVQGSEALGSQLPFAVWDAVARRACAQELRPAFSTWKTRPDALVSALSPLWSEPARHRRAMAQVCLDLEIEPPLAPPTLEALRAMLEGADEASLDENAPGA